MPVSTVRGVLPSAAHIQIQRSWPWAENQIEMSSVCMCVCAKAKSKYLCFMLMRICLTFCCLNIGKRQQRCSRTRCSRPGHLCSGQKNDKCVGPLVKLWLHFFVPFYHKQQQQSVSNEPQPRLWFLWIY